MPYQVLARKYRPQTFDDVIGQAHVATTLTNALRQGKVAHAYLFSGPRGVGKTTTARILAKALNCVKGPTAIPCNQCDSCQRIAQGQELVDVLEIDAASNRGIEEIRELRDNVRYAPARSRYKVYIVDEAHQITHDAFNAFLKTLEEPPEHAVFVLATTEHQKIPATILSRCQLFRFKRVSAEEIAQRLEKILSSEKLTVERAAIERLAKAAGGSVRDALSLMDQALAYSPEALTARQVEVLLGFLPEEFLIGFVSALLERKPAGVLGWIKQLSEEGWELPQFVRDFREFLRTTMVEQLGAGAAPNALKLAGRPVTLAELLQMIRVMGQCLDEMRWNDNPQIVLELYSLRLTQPFVDIGELMRRLEQVEKGGGESQAPAPHPSPLPTSSASPTAKGDSPPVAVGNDEKNAASTDAAGMWKRLLTELWKKPAVASHLERAHLKSATEKEWVISFADKFALDSVQRSQSLVAEVLHKLTGNPVIVRLIHEVRDTRESEPMVVGAPPPATIDEDHPALQDERVKKVLQLFKGKIRASEGGSE